MLRLYGSVILFLLYFSATGQVIFDQLPYNLQLYPRDANDQAQVVVSGRLSDPAYTKIGMQVLREGALNQVISQTLVPASTDSAFSLASIIKAEPAEYSFRVFLYKGSDSTLVAERKRIVCGDVYIIHGQSNALAITNLELYSTDFDDKYMRTVAIPDGGTTTDIAWFPAKQPFGSVGGIGLTLQRLILQNYGIPTCVLNGAVGGATIDVLSARIPDNHANPYTYYGSLLFRAQWANVAKRAKAIIWKQGEAESGSPTPGYAGKFTTLYNQFREDYGDMRIYVGQINILSNPQDSAAALRDYQRRTKYLFNNLETIATVGTPGYGGTHYTGLANQQLAFEQFRLIARDVYGSTDTLQINSPDIKKAFYNTRKDSITLVFDDQMQMVWTNDTTFYNYATGTVMTRLEQKDYFYLDKQAGLIANGSASGNRVVLSLKQPVSAKTIRYLPAFYGDYVSIFYNGPTLRNTRGMRAFSFDSVPIADALSAVTNLAAKPISGKQIDINWLPPATAQTQILERSDGTPNNFKTTVLLSGTATSYTDLNVPDPFGIYYYRLLDYNSVSESPSSNVVSVRPLVLGLDPADPIVQLYPNPLTNHQPLQVMADQFTFTDIMIRDILGRVVRSWHGPAKSQLSIDVDNLDAGMYTVELQTAGSQTLRRKVVIR